MNEHITIEVPTIRDDKNGYLLLIKLAEAIRNDPLNDFTFTFKRCSLLSQNAVCMLGALAILVDKANTFSAIGLSGLQLPIRGVMFDLKSMNSNIVDQLEQNNFLSHFHKIGLSGNYPEGDYIGYRQHDEFLDTNEIATHLRYHWLSDEKLRISEDLKLAIVSKIFEIFMNAYGHGVMKNNTEMGRVVSCGYHDQKSKQLKITVLDFGLGIVDTVKKYLPNELSDELAMKWALESGNSTKTDSIDPDTPRGLGFDLLKRFVTVNKGSMVIFSNTCHAFVNNEGEYTVEKLKIPFKGTIITIMINCDDRYYQFLQNTDNQKSYF
jgi:anti-sigma regulatory factor (Ser/Thr protein kinase)